MKISVNELFSWLNRLVIVLSVALLTFVACEQENTAEIVEVPSDEEIATTLQAQLNQAPAVPHHNIKISINEGLVTLSGSINNLLASERATEIAESVRGVLSVVNNLKITESRPDQAVARDINQAIKQDPATETWDVSADVNNGHVILIGSVESWQERQLVETIAEGVKGVKSINNNILVNYDEARPDEEIRNEVQQTMLMDSRIRENRIRVVVKDNIVSLSGSVGSVIEKTLAMEKAYVAGVDSVVVDNLEVHPEFQSKLFRSDELTRLNSDEIRNAVEQALKYDPRVPESRIDVSVSEGTVTLSGTVYNLNSKISAEQDALHTAGVDRVENNIEVVQKIVVRPEVPTTNDAVETRIREAIIRDPYVEQNGIKVNVDDGIVELSGTIDTKFEKQQAEEVVRNVKGVIAINNNLKVTGISET